jgi:hypothetical protein
MPSFRRFHSANVNRDVAPVKGWRYGGYSCEIGPQNGPADGAPEFEVRGLESEGTTGDA